MRVRFSTDARNDLRQIFGHIAETNGRAATRVIERIRAATRLLSDFPHIGRVGLVDGTREWLVHGVPYIIVYDIEARQGIVVIVAVFHTARNR